MVMLNGSPWIAGRIAFARGEAEGLFDEYLMKETRRALSPITCFLTGDQNNLQCNRK